MPNKLTDKDFIEGGADALVAQFMKISNAFITLEKEYQKIKNMKPIDGKSMTDLGASTKNAAAAVKEYEKAQKNLNLTNVEAKEKTKNLTTEVRLQAKENIAASGSIAKLRAETNNLNKKREQLDLTTKQGIKLEKQYSRQIAQNEKQLKSYDAKIGRFQRNVGNYAKGIKNMIGAYLGFTAVVGLFKNIVGTFRDFEKANSNLQAVLGLTKKEMVSLKKQAKDLGSSTAYTASQVVSLQTELAKLGFTTKEITSSTGGILSLAAATGTDLAGSASIAGATLRSFGLDAIEMNRVTDVLAKSTATSALDMQKLAVAMPIVGATAKTAGVSLERTVSLLGTLSDRGMDASSASTSLRNIFLELSKRGLTWNQAMTMINNATDKNVVALDLFGKRGATAGIILAENADSAGKLEKALNGAAGAAREMADTQLDNLAGDVTKLTSAWEGLILSLEDGEGTLSKAMRSITQLFTHLLSVVKDLNEGISITNRVMIDTANNGVTKLMTAMQRLSREKQIEILTEQLEKNKATINGLLDSSKELAASNLVNGFTTGEELAALKLKSEYYIEQRKRLEENLIALKNANTETEEEVKVTDEATDSVEEYTRVKSMAKIINQENAKVLDDTVERIMPALILETKELSDVQLAALAAVQRDKDEREKYYKDITDAAIEANDRLLDHLSKANEMQLKMIDERVARRDQEINELNEQINQQIALNQTGAAADIGILQAALRMQQQAREQDLKEKERIQKRELALDLIKQASDLATAIAGVYASESKLGVPGIILATAGVAGMIASFAAFKAQARSLGTGGVGDEYGVVDGKYHNADGSGGERLIDWVNVEKGERFGVLNRTASNKYGQEFYDIVRSMNDGDFDAAADGHTIIIKKETANSRHLDLIAQTNKLLAEIKNAPNTTIDNGKIVVIGSNFKKKYV